MLHVRRSLSPPGKFIFHWWTHPRVKSPLLPMCKTAWYLLIVLWGIDYLFLYRDGYPYVILPTSIYLFLSISLSLSPSVYTPRYSEGPSKIRFWTHLSGPISPKIQNIIKHRSTQIHHVQVIFPKIPWDFPLGLALTAACGRLLGALPRRGAAGGGQSAAGWETSES